MNESEFQNDNIQKDKDIEILINEKSKEIHGKCVPLELYQKVYNDRNELLKKSNNFNLIIKQKEKEKMILQIKIKKYEKEKESNNNILLTQEKYVVELNKKIEKLESAIMKYKEEIFNKEKEILLSKEKFDEFQNNLDNYKNIAKINYEQEIEKLNKKIKKLNNEINLKNNKIENFEKKYKFLQEKYLKALNQKQIKDQENVYKSSRILKAPLINGKFRINQSKEDIFNFITSNSNTISQTDLIRDKYKKIYDNNFLVIENDDKEDKNNNDLGNINILPNINNNKNKKSKNKTKNNSLKNDENEIYEENNL